jgi:hypothetical protein
MPPTTLLLGGPSPLVAEGLADAERLGTAGAHVDILAIEECSLARSGESLAVVAITCP